MFDIHYVTKKLDQISQYIDPISNSNYNGKDGKDGTYKLFQSGTPVPAISSNQTNISRELHFIDAFTGDMHFGYSLALQSIVA